MADQWAKNNWLSSDAITHTRLNDIGNSIRTWGYGETAGSVTVNANNNNLANVGALTASSLQCSLYTIQSTAPVIAFRETDAGADAKLSKIYADTGALWMTFANDADTAATAWLHVTRSGYTPVLIQPQAPVRVNNATPSVEWLETDASANAKLWKQYASSGTLFCTCVNDAESSESQWMTVERSGASPTFVTFPESVSIRRGTLAASSALPGGNWAGRVFAQPDDASEWGLVVGNRYQAVSSVAFRVGSLADTGSGFQTWFDVRGNGQIVTPVVAGPYANQAAAIAAGLSSGMWYKTSAGALMVV